MRALSFKNENLNLSEPFDGLFTQGMVCHETYKDQNNNWVSPDEIITINGKKYLKNNKKEMITVGPSESMSKSKKNTVDPEEIIENFGADSARLFIISDSPPEKDVQWSDEGIVSSYKFVQKLWIMSQKILNVIKENKDDDTSNDGELDRIVDEFTYKVEKNLDSFRYNKIVANFHELYALLSKTNLKFYSSLNLKKNYSKILITIMPVMPHFANECLELIGVADNVKWPTIKEKNLTQKNINYIIQINGKTRQIIEGKKDLSKETLIELIKQNQKLNKYLKENTVIKKLIFVPNKIINIII